MKSPRRKAPADAPSTYVDRDYRRRKAAEGRALDARAAELAGPVEVRQVEPQEPPS